MFLAKLFECSRMYFVTIKLKTATNPDSYPDLNKWYFATVCFSRVIKRAIAGPCSFMPAVLSFQLVPMGHFTQRAATTSTTEYHEKVVVCSLFLEK